MEKYDALVVLGKNIGVGWTRQRIKKTKHFLSDRAEFSVMAGGVLFKTGNFDKIIFSAGKTAGKNYPSEAEAMSKFLLLNFSDIPKDKIILEDISTDTLENAIEVKKIIDKLGINKILVLTTPEHTRRSKMLFKRVGIDTDVMSSEDALKNLKPDLYEKYKYKTSVLEVIFERTAYVVQLIPVFSNLAHSVVTKTRSKD